uniref:Coiled-coil domain-containing protein 186 n=2 Tax=Timema TaxID=61471 RepID=A0A7R9D8W2_TIMPO|nr:unnamed protein product [Timema douglasi]CAD7410105.1 unnamed protein product [Timema poppensis]
MVNPSCTLIDISMGDALLNTMDERNSNIELVISSSSEKETAYLCADNSLINLENLNILEDKGIDLALNKSTEIIVNSEPKDYDTSEGNSAPTIKNQIIVEIGTQVSDESKNQLPNGVSGSLLNQPAYRTVIQELLHSKEQIAVFKSEINKLEAENQRLEADRSHDIYLVQLETLEKTIGQQQNELQQAKQQAEASNRNFTQLKVELEQKIDKLMKLCESATREKEAMVVRYAVSEKEVIDQKKERETLEKRLKETSKEKELLLGKLKSLTADKTRVCQMLDSKCHESTTFQKENEKLKEDLRSREIKIKWTQNKLHMEMDANKEAQASLGKAMQKLQESREECEQIRQDSQAMIRAYQQSQENKTQTLDQQLKEQKAKLIIERHEWEHEEETRIQLQQEIENLKKKQEVIINENNTISLKVQSLEKERLEYEQNLSRLKTTMDSQRQEVVDMRAQLAEMEALRVQLQYQLEKLLASQSEVERLRLSNADLQQDMAGCREREAELLDFTQKLTDKNVRLQSEFSATEAKAQQLELELIPLQRQITELESRLAALTTSLQQERQQRQGESQLLARHLAEKSQRADDLAQQLEDQQGENQVLKRKQAAALKELTRELQQTRKRLEAYEASSCTNSLGHDSRTSSCSSLNTVEAAFAPNIANSTDSSGLGQPSPPIEPDRQALIERIVKLQRANARKTEKLEFLEEHSRQLVTELQKKSHIILSYIMREQDGALSSNSMDQNKAEVTKHGGIMASVYSSKPVDNSMTLELSLEINRKLQAVLEDILLKNITLKENIDTLGSEIARLTSGMTSDVQS